MTLYLNFFYNRHPTFLQFHFDQIFFDFTSICSLNHFNYFVKYYSILFILDLYQLQHYFNYLKHLLIPLHLILNYFSMCFKYSFNFSLIFQNNSLVLIHYSITYFNSMNFLIEISFYYYFNKMIILLELLYFQISDNFE